MLWCRWLRFFVLNGETKRVDSWRRGRSARKVWGSDRVVSEARAGPWRRAGAPWMPGRRSSLAAQGPTGRVAVAPLRPRGSCGLEPGHVGSRFQLPLELRRRRAIAPPWPASPTGRCCFTVGTDPECVPDVGSDDGPTVRRPSPRVRDPPREENSRNRAVAWGPASTLTCGRTISLPPVASFGSHSGSPPLPRRLNDRRVPETARDRSRAPGPARGAPPGRPPPRRTAPRSRRAGPTPSGLERHLHRRQGDARLALRAVRRSRHRCRPSDARRRVRRIRATRSNSSGPFAVLVDDVVARARPPCGPRQARRRPTVSRRSRRCREGQRRSPRSGRYGERRRRLRPPRPHSRDGGTVGGRAVRPLEPQSGDGRRAGDGAYHGGAPVSLATPLRPVRSGGRRQNQPRPTLRIGAVDITRTVKILDGLERPGLQPSPIPVPLNRITEFDELVTRQGLVPVRVRAVAPRGRESGHHPGGASGTRARAAPSDLRPQCHSGRGRRSAPTNTETTTSSSRAPGPLGRSSTRTTVRRPPFPVARLIHSIRARLDARTSAAAASLA